MKELMKLGAQLIISLRSSATLDKLLIILFLSPLKLGISTKDYLRIICDMNPNNGRSKKWLSLVGGHRATPIPIIPKLTKPFSLLFVPPATSLPHHGQKGEKITEEELIQVEKRHDLPKVLGLLACLHQQLAVMEREADHLLDLRDDVHVA